MEESSEEHPVNELPQEDTKIALNESSDDPETERLPPPIPPKPQSLVEMTNNKKISSPLAAPPAVPPGAWLHLQKPKREKLKLKWAFKGKREDEDLRRKGDKKRKRRDYKNKRKSSSFGGFHFEQYLANLNLPKEDKLETPEYAHIYGTTDMVGLFRTCSSSSFEEFARRCDLFPTKQVVLPTDYYVLLAQDEREVQNEESRPARLTRHQSFDNGRQLGLWKLPPFEPYHQKFEHDPKANKEKLRNSGQGFILPRVKSGTSIVPPPLPQKPLHLNPIPSPTTPVVVPDRSPHPSAVQDALIFKLKPRKEGFLLVKRRRRWVILDEQNLYIFKSPDDFTSTPTVISLHYCAVRKHKDGVAFEIVTSGKNYVFAMDKDEKQPKVFTFLPNLTLDSWIRDIQVVCENLVLNTIGGNDTPLLSKSYSTLLGEQEVLPPNSREVIEVIAKGEGNRTCADCGEKDPDWASINLGIFVCIQCSGIHRSFGTHISKVRSVKFDHWEPGWVENMRAVGNTAANKIWLANVPSGSVSITESSDLEARKKWLTMKYVEGRFTATGHRVETVQIPGSPNQVDIYSPEFKTHFKAAMLKTLKEDTEFLQQVREILKAEENNLASPARNKSRPTTPGRNNTKSPEKPASSNEK